MKAIAETTIAKLNRATAAGKTADEVAKANGLTEVKREGNEFDGTALFKNKRGGYATLWFGSDYPDQGFDGNLDIWE